MLLPCSWLTQLHEPIITKALSQLCSPVDVTLATAILG